MSTREKKKIDRKDYDRRYYLKNRAKYSRKKTEPLSPPRISRGDIFKEQNPDWEERIKILSESEQITIKAFFGLKDGKPKTLQAIADILGYSREYVRRIKDSGLKKLGYVEES